jgi:hypothetical protein
MIIAAAAAGGGGGGGGEVSAALYGAVEALLEVCNPQDCRV